LKQTAAPILDFYPRTALVLANSFLNERERTHEGATGQPQGVGGVGHDGGK